MQVDYRQDADYQQLGVAASETVAPRKSELTFSLQNFQVDNQLLNASMPVVVCRRERQLGDRGAGNQGLLKAAQREIERQRQGAPLLTVQCKRTISNQQGSIHDSVVIKCASLVKWSPGSCTVCAYTVIDRRDPGMQRPALSPGSSGSMPRGNLCRVSSEVREFAAVARLAS